ncbi:MAG: LLM class flavin-dependent oxidoreductase [Candidatus Rokubacteria bacterium]|nr:LLM class flavin-dependent oxidoreductase [Candidatus Rokubacteria bacterium]
MKFGQLHLFENPMGRTEKEIVDEQFDIMVRAEEYGFDSVWPAEHHFSEYGYCASPAVTLAALAERTKRIRLGTGVVVLTLNHPIRVAEDYAILDLMSDGRVDLGVGRGYQPHEFAGYGVDQTRSRDIFHESVEIIQKAWTEERFSYEGEFYRIHDVSVRPKPLQKPHPPIWMASLSPETFELCGRYGFNLMCAPVFGFNVNSGAEHIEQYRQALRDHGRDPAHHEIAALTMTYVAETTQQALADFRDAVMWYYRTFAKYIAPPKGQGPVPTYEMYTRARDFLEVVEWDAVVQAGAVVCGSPDQVVDRIGQIAELCGFTTYLAWTRIGGLAHEKVLRCMELMAERVMPQLRGAGATTPAS